MNIITAEHITISYTGKNVLDDVSFSMDDGDKTGIIGLNGAGKSSLLKIIAGIVTPDSGNVTMRRNLKISYLPQTPEFTPGITALEAALCSNSHLLNGIGSGESPQTWHGGNGHGEPHPGENASYAASPDETDPVLRTETIKLLTQLGITDLTQNIDVMSGGQKKRIALVRTILTPSDVYILDEPTNHLDTMMNEYLEDFLKRTKNAVIMVTHDRYFLDSVTNRIVEVNKGKLYQYDCNYFGYLERKAEREQIALSTQEKNKNILRKEMAWMMRGARARSTKQKAHIKRYEALRDIPDLEIQGQVVIQSASRRLGKKTIEINDISKSFDGREIIKDFTYYFNGGDRIGITGPNGCGKSTLLKIITGKIQPDRGSVEMGSTVKIGYFSQEGEEMDPSEKVIDYVKEGGEVIHTDDGPVTASAMLDNFLFSDDLKYSPIAKLSGGERRRLGLLRILMEAPNILILDEPTNDLDIETLNILEDYLDSFKGIVITVSHDRYFLDRVVRRIFAFEDCRLVQYEGGFTDYLNALRRKKEASESTVNPASPGKSGSSSAKNSEAVSEKSGNATENQERKNRHELKFTYREEQEYGSIEQEIGKLEERLSEIEKEISENSSDFGKLTELSAEKEKISGEIDEKTERWMYLEEKAEQIKKNKEGR